MRSGLVWVDTLSLADMSLPTKCWISSPNTKELPFRKVSPFTPPRA